MLRVAPGAVCPPVARTRAAMRPFGMAVHQGKTADWADRARLPVQARAAHRSHPEATRTANLAMLVA